MLEKTPESPLGSRETQPVHPKGDQSWVFTAETPILWPPDAKSWLIWKDTDAGKDWGQEEKGMTEDEMVGWHHWLNGHGFGWTPGVGDGQGGLACCSSCVCKESDMTEQLNWTELKSSLHYSFKFHVWLKIFKIKNFKYCKLGESLKWYLILAQSFSCHYSLIIFINEP